VLRALREVRGLLAEVLQREQLGVALGGRRHELRRVDLDVVAVDPVAAHRVLERRRDAEDEGVATLAQVDEAPVHALVDAAVGRDRRLRQRGGCHVERTDLDLDAAELDALVVLELTRDRQEGAGRQFGDHGGEGERRGILVRRLGVGAGRGVHELHGAGLIAQDDELHLLLIADGLDPSGHRHGAVFTGLQLADKGAFTHEGPVYVAARAGCGCPWHPLATFCGYPGRVFACRGNRTRARGEGGAVVSQPVHKGLPRRLKVCPPIASTSCAMGRFTTPSACSTGDCRTTA
jgi:hypothetical protein